MKGLFGFLMGLALGCLALLAPAQVAPALGAPALGAPAPESARESAATADQTPAELERHLAAYVAGARVLLGEGEDGAAACLDADQQRWEQTTRAACAGDAACLRRAILARLATLDSHQPGASRITAFPLPRAPVLVTALPPVAELEDASGGDRNADVPLTVTGQLVHENADIENMGLAIRTPDGRSTVLVPDMDIGSSPTHDALFIALKEDRSEESRGSGATGLYRAEGVKDPASGGFALNHCRFVYRLPGE